VASGKGAKRSRKSRSEAPPAHAEPLDGRAEEPAAVAAETANSEHHGPSIGRILPRTFQGRLSIAFVMVFAMALCTVSILTLIVLNTNLRTQEETNLQARANATAEVVRVTALSATLNSQGNQVVLSASGQLNPAVAAAVGDQATLADFANEIAQADLRLRFGLGYDNGADIAFYPAGEPSTFSAALTAQPGRGQTRDSISYTRTYKFVDPAGVKPTWYLEVSLSAPYTTRASTIADVASFLVVATVAAMLAAIVASYFLARRFTTPLRRLTIAARALADGNLSMRVPAAREATGAAEITELSRQFNAMADQVEETMEVIRRDRDASREFLADVSHELRTPLAALRTFNELLRETAGADEAARTEFLEASAQQIERLDWLAQNLLELSKLESGLVRLDLRPDDIRATVEWSVEQAQVSAQRRGVALSMVLPDTAVVTRHDPQRLGQVLINLIGNALKFTPRGGSVRVTLAPQGKGARIQVSDTGVGIDASELPHIFERFYRGSRVNEARGSGSGLGLAIVRSIVDMHGGRVLVESRVGVGSTFTVTLPPDPRVVISAAATAGSPTRSGAATGGAAHAPAGAQVPANGTTAGGARPAGRAAAAAAASSAATAAPRDGDSAG
jgi:signal transduction histidine kinase